MYATAVLWADRPVTLRLFKETSSFARVLKIVQLRDEPEKETCNCCKILKLSTVSGTVEAVVFPPRG